MTPPIAALVAPPPECDNTQDLPRMFVLLTPTECNTSLTYTQWKEADASMRHRLSLNARAVLGYTAQRIFARHQAHAQLRRGSGTDSLSDDAACQVAIALLSERLARLKLRGLRHLSDDRFASLAGATPVIHKLSIASSSFGP
uniref:Uncharacterized protein n=1 Tax=Oryza nivara TaxID=4536 RepID=A0A0E0GZN1_ORYNI